MITYHKTSDIHLQSLAKLLEENDMGHRDITMLDRSLRHSFFTMAAMDGTKLVGFGRVISDKQYYAFICDVAVLPAYQGKGVGTQLIQGILHELAPHQFRMIGLFTAEKNRSFYEHLGFTWCEEIHAMKRK